MNGEKVGTVILNRELLVQHIFSSEQLLPPYWL